jgi:hypothetical protein
VLNTDSLPRLWSDVGLGFRYDSRDIDVNAAYSYSLLFAKFLILKRRSRKLEPPKPRQQKEREREDDGRPTTSEAGVRRAWSEDASSDT